MDQSIGPESPPLPEIRQSMDKHKYLLFAYIRVHGKMWFTFKNFFPFCSIWNDWILLLFLFGQGDG